jgi:DNA-binding CsgD family transcriptional regulator
MARTWPVNPAQGSLEALIYRIHAESGRRAQWTEVLDKLRGWLGAPLVSLCRHDFAEAHGAMLCEVPADAEFRASYAAHAGRNPWFLSSADYVVGRVMTGDELMSNKDLVRTDFYRRVLKPTRLLYHICGVIALRGEVVHYISAFRGEERGEFGEQEKSALKQVLSHMSLALENQWRYEEVDDLARALSHVVDQQSYATLLATADGRLVYKNKKAKALCVPDRGVSIDDGAIRATTSANNKALREAILEVSRSAATDGHETSRVITISAARGHSSSILIVRPAGRAFRAELGAPVDLVILTLRDAHSEHDPRNCVFARQFSLTPAQARVNALVFGGHSLLGVARTLHVSENTVRSHLKQVFEKTNTHGQMELVHLHARVCVDEG